jgi:Protein of unknown function (DUF4019)
MKNPVAEAKKVGGEQALTWLHLVDQGQYAQSWQQAGALFREQVTREQWVGQVKGAREPLGALSRRTLDSASYAEVLPGAPPGSYVVLVYRSSFTRLAAAREQATVAREKDGTWRVVGYFVRPAPSPG